MDDQSLNPPRSQTGLPGAAPVRRDYAANQRPEDSSSEGHAGRFGRFGRQPFRKMTSVRLLRTCKVAFFWRSAVV